MDRPLGCFVSIAVSDGYAYGVLSDDCRVYRTSVSNMSCKDGHAWEVMSVQGEPWVMSISVSSGVMYAVGANQGMYSQTLSSMTVQSSWVLLARANARAVGVGSGLIFFVSDDGKLYKQSLSERIESNLWEPFISTGVVWDVAVDEAYVYGIGNDHYVYRHDLEVTKNSRWEPARRGKWAAIAINEGRLYGLGICKKSRNMMYHQSLDAWPFNVSFAYYELSVGHGMPQTRKLEADWETKAFQEGPIHYAPWDQCSSVRLVCISDTHNAHRALELPRGDVLIHAGDLTNNGTAQELADVADWFDDLQGHFRQIIAVAGNHDRVLWQSSTHSQCMSADTAAEARRKLEKSCKYLEDESTMESMVDVYGTPWTPLHGHARTAFMLPTGEALLKRWQQIPTDTDVLVVHGPPFGRGDLCRLDTHVGCRELLQELRGRVRPRVVICGHIHEARGSSFDGHTLFLNVASKSGTRGAPLNPPMVVDVPLDRALSARLVDSAPPP